MGFQIWNWEISFVLLPENKIIYKDVSVISTFQRGGGKPGLALCFEKRRKWAPESIPVSTMVSVGIIVEVTDEGSALDRLVEQWVNQNMYVSNNFV